MLSLSGVRSEVWNGRSAESVPVFQKGISVCLFGRLVFEAEEPASVNVKQVQVRFEGKV